MTKSCRRVLINLGMKKLLLIFLLPSLGFFFFAGLSRAQSPASSNSRITGYFESSPSVRGFYSKALTQPLSINVSPFVTINIQPGTFTDDVTVLIFNQIFSKTRGLLSPLPEYPLASNYLMFIDTKGNQILPQKPVEADVSVPYANISTYLIQIKPDGYLDNTNIGVTNSSYAPFIVKVLLNPGNPRFIVAVNKVITQANTVPPFATANNQANAQQENSSPNFLLILAIIVLVVAVIIVAYRLLKNNGRKKPPVKRVKEPQRIIVGGK